MKQFINNAIIGNSRILASIGEKAEIIRLYWPHIDYTQNIEKMSIGVYFPNLSNNMHWISSEDWNSEQEYIEDTNILVTKLKNHQLELEIIIKDFCMISKDVVVRNLKIMNTSKYSKNINICLYAKGQDSEGAIFDFDADGIVFHKKENYMFISGDRECKQFQLNNNPFEACNRLYLYGVEEYSLNNEGAQIFELNEVDSNSSVEFNLYICFDKTLNGSRKLLRSVKSVQSNSILKETQKYWNNLINRIKPLKEGCEDYLKLYKRSVLALKLMSNENGAILASPEIDEDRQRCGGYGYCWTRDGAYIAEAFDKCGLSELSEKFYKWAISIQDDGGYWHQRYYTNGDIAPSWGIQYDETSSIVWGIWRHYSETKDIDFLKSTWDSVYNACQFLINNIDEKYGLNKICYDLWEERIGMHIYTSSSIYSGILCAINIAKTLKKGSKTISNWEYASYNLKINIEKYFYNKDINRFIRSINVKLNPWGAEGGQVENFIVNNKGYERDFSVIDDKSDSSLIGIVYPFRIFDVNDSRIQNTIEHLVNTLKCENGGILRYQYDNYIGGNAWIISTLWLADYYIEKKDFKAAKKLIDFCKNGTTELNLLPEQINKYSEKPEWIIPLAWSHAAFINTLFNYIGSIE